MKNKILKTFLFFVLFSALLVTASFATNPAEPVKIKEDVSMYKTKINIIGATRINPDVTITAAVAANAGLSEAKVRFALNEDIPSNLEVTIYSYDPDFEEWSEIKKDGTTKLVEDPKELEKIENNLSRIFFVDNEEKSFEISYKGTVDKNSISTMFGKVEYDSTTQKFIVPALTFHFSFTSNGAECYVNTKVDETTEDYEYEYGDFEIIVNASISLELPEKIKAQKLAEFTVSTIGNDYTGKKVYYSFSVMSKEIDEPLEENVIEKIEYYDEKSGNWYELNLGWNMCTTELMTLGNTTSKYRITFNKAGEYKLSAAIVEMVDEMTGNWLASEYNDIVVDECKLPEVKFELPQEIIAGKTAEFTVSTTANDFKGLNILGTGGISNPDLIEKLEYYEVNGENAGKWLELPAGSNFGAPGGFPLDDATSKFRVIFNNGGECIVNFAIINAETSQVLANAETTINVLTTKELEVFNEDELGVAVALPEVDKVTLGADIEITKPILVNKELTLNLNGKTIENKTGIWNDTDEMNDWSLISVRAGGILTIDGNGTVKALENDCFAIDVQEGGNVTIKNGKYVGNISAVYVCEGIATIDGGDYSIQQLSKDNDYRFTLNCWDENYTNGTASIIVNDGTFMNFDPADNLAEGPNTSFVPKDVE